jgi:hypothetical protein
LSVEISGLRVLSLRLADLYCAGHARGGCHAVAPLQVIENKIKTIPVATAGNGVCAAE